MRQADVLKLLVQGKPNKLICRDLRLSEGTVKVHVSAILRALNVHTRTQVVIELARRGVRLEPRAGVRALTPGRHGSAASLAPGPRSRARRSGTRAADRDAVHAVAARDDVDAAGRGNPDRGHVEDRARGAVRGVGGSDRREPGVALRARAPLSSRRARPARSSARWGYASALGSATRRRALGHCRRRCCSCRATSATRRCSSSACSA